MKRFGHRHAEVSGAKWKGPDALIALVALLAALAVLFGTADGTSEAARQGIHGIHAEAALSAAAAARNQVAQAQVLAVAEGLHAASEAELSEAIGLAEQSLLVLSGRLASLRTLAGEDALEVICEPLL